MLKRLITPRAMGRYVVCAILICVAVTIPDQLTAQTKACIPTTSGSFAALTGIVARGHPSGGCTGNPAWDAVVPFALSPGSTIPATGNALASGTIRLTRTTNNIYIGFTVDQDEDFSSFDKAILVFDATNDDTWGAGDFYVVIKLGPANPVVAGTLCPAQATVEGVFKWDVAQVRFVQDDASPLLNTMSGVKVLASYDYDLPDDNESKIWNLEIELPIAAAGLQTGGAGFGIGAYLLVAKGSSAVLGKVLRWPAGIVERRVSDVDLNLPAVVPTTLADADLSDNCFDMNFANTALPLTSNSTTEVNKTGPTKFTMWYWFAGPPSTGPGAGPNKGNLHVKVYRTTATTSWETIFDNTQQVSIDGFNQAHHAIFDMTAPGGTQATDFCSDVYLEGWQFDDDKTDASNHTHINYIPLATSETTRDLDLPVDGIPGLAAGATTSLLINLSTTNDPNGRQLGLSGQEKPDRSAGLFILAGAACLGAAGMVRRRKSAALLLAMVGVGAIINGCRPQPPAGPIGTDRWDLTNAKDLGLTPLPGEPGWYRMPARHGELKRAKLHFTGRPLPYQTVSDSLPMSMDASGRPAVKRIAVRQGQVVSVFAFGTVDVDGAGPLQPTDAAGLIRNDDSPRLAISYPLARSRYVPAENVGALIGSFDGLKTSFVIGTNGSFVVPNGTEQLTLTINGLPSDYRSAVGRYGLKWIVSQGPNSPTATSYGFDTPLDQPTFVLGWLVLTSVNVKTFYEVPVKNPETGQTLMGRAELGEAHFSIYESHVQ